MHLDHHTAHDEIRLTGLTVRGHHGVFDFEKRDGQDFVIDAVLRGDLTAPARSDDLADTIDYGTLADDLAAIVAGEPYDLIEALAGALVDKCLERCADAQVTVHKPQAPIAHAFADVAVTLRRTRAQQETAPAAEAPETPAAAAAAADADDSAPAAEAGSAPAAPAAVPAAVSSADPSPRSLRAVIALGANLGDARGALQEAAHALDLHPRIRVRAGSAIYVTAPVGGVEQPDFHNAAVLVETTLPARELLAVCQGIEVGAGRTRTVRWGPRTLDIDLIAAQDAATGAPVTSADPVLELPHPRAAERAFVLAPWADVDPQAVADTPDGPVPVAQVRDARAAQDGVIRTDDRVWGADTGDITAAGPDAGAAQHPTLGRAGRSTDGPVEGDRG